MRGSPHFCSGWGGGLRSQPCFKSHRGMPCSSMVSRLSPETYAEALAERNGNWPSPCPALPNEQDFSVVQAGEESFTQKDQQTREQHKAINYLALLKTGDRKSFISYTCSLKAHGKFAHSSETFPRGHTSGEPNEARDSQICLWLGPSGEKKNVWYMKELFEVTDADAAVHLGERREYHGSWCQESGGLFLLMQGEAEDI